MIPNDMPFDFKRLLFPVRLACTMSINKSQGQSLRVCGINIENPCFSHGQLYVALSRGISMSTTKVLVKIENPKYKRGTYTKNVVYKEVVSSHR